jgi:hydroxymethylbilane synthase
VDFAVHSFKDVPVTMPLVDTAELVIAATPLREDPRDVLASLSGGGLMDLKQGARVGTGSLRRQAQVMELRKDLVVEPIRGNVDTRLRKMKSGEYDGVILAMSGLKRSGLLDASIMRAMDELLPAAGQGALAIECRRDDAELREILGRLNDPMSALAVRLERAVVLGLNGDCHSPIAAYATVEAGAKGKVTLNAAVGGRGGVPPVIRAEASAGVEQADGAAEEVLKQLKAQGAMELLGTGK